MIIKDIIKNRLGLEVSPGFCTFLVTWRCNARCQMCSIWQKDDTADELSLAEIKKIFSQQKFDGVRISGGEPFLRNDISEIINIIQDESRPKVLHLTSNGLLTEKIINTVKALEKTNNLHIKISIDALGQKHDQIRGINGAYQKAMETVKLLTELKKSKKFYLGINQTIVDSDGINDYYQLKEICDKLGIQLHAVIAYRESAIYGNDKNLNLMPKNAVDYKFFYNFSQSEIDTILKILKQEAKSIKDFKEKIIKKYYLRGFYNRIIKKRAEPNPSCLELKNHLRINPNGDVPICLFNSTVAGNLKTQDIKEIWQSQNTKNARKLISQCPGCWVDCEVIPNAIYTGDLIKEIWH